MSITMQEFVDVIRGRVRDMADPADLAVILAPLSSDEQADALAAVARFGWSGVAEFAAELGYYLDRVGAADTVASWLLSEPVVVERDLDTEGLENLLISMFTVAELWRFVRLDCGRARVESDCRTYPETLRAAARVVARAVETGRLNRSVFRAALERKRPRRRAEIAAVLAAE